MSTAPKVCPHQKSFGYTYPAVWIRLSAIWVYFSFTPEEALEPITQHIDLSIPHKLRIEHFEESPGDPEGIWIFQICVDDHPCKSRQYNHPGKRDIPLPQMNLYLSGPCWEPMKGVIHSFGVNLMSIFSFLFR